jgi:hypothetical protein
MTTSQALKRLCCPMVASLEPVVVPLSIDLIHDFFYKK